MARKVGLLLAVIGSWFGAVAQTSLTVIDDLHCVPGSGMTALPNCNSFYNQADRCSTATGKADSQACFCNQSFLNAIYECKNEERICFGNGNLDNQWESIANSWHSGCDAAISFRPTTPALSTITSTYDAQVCVKYASACASGTRELSSCFNGYTASADRSSCICAPKIQSIAYTCQYLGNITCQLTTAALSNLFAYSSCSNYQSVMANITAAETSTSKIASSTSSTPFTSSVMVTRPSLTGASATATSSSAALLCFDSTTICKGFLWWMFAIPVAAFTL